MMVASHNGKDYARVPDVTLSFFKKPLQEQYIGIVESVALPIIEKSWMVSCKSRVFTKVKSS